MKLEFSDGQTTFGKSPHECAGSKTPDDSLLVNCECGRMWIFPKSSTEHRVFEEYNLHVSKSNRK